jgi:hypothetical protein
MPFFSSESQLLDTYQHTPEDSSHLQGVSVDSQIHCMVCVCAC